MKTLSIQRQRPSIKIWIPALSNTPVKSAPVNWLPLGVQLLDLAFARRLGVEPHASVERPRRVLEKLLLPGANLVGRR
jgi:hypothetical protein